jgi:hypothetical protein
MRIRAAIALGLVVTLTSAGVLLSQRDTRLAGKNTALPNTVLKRGIGDTRLCQRHELLPRDTTTIRLSLQATDGPGPSLRVTATRAGEVLTRGARQRGWHGEQIAIPVARVERTVEDVKVCVVAGKRGVMTLLGDRTRGQARRGQTAVLDSLPAEGRLAVAYLRPGRATWWAYAPTIAHRVGLEHAWPGAWAALLAAAFMLAAAVCGLAWLIREQTPKPAATPDPPQRVPRGRALLRRVPAAGWICALVGMLNAAAWALITPPFQVPDEQDHFAYVQRLAETGRPPTGDSQRYSQEQTLVLAGLRFRPVAAQAAIGIWSRAERQRLDRALAARPNRRGSGSAGTATPQPPLFYALEAVPYLLARSGSLLDRLALMRIVSVLLAGATVLFVYLFVREVLPSTPWAWTVGALALGLQPLFGYTAGAVNPDSLLYLSSAALFYCLARGFRRGLTPRLAVATGVALAVGLTTKLTFLGLLPGAALALLLLAFRQREGSVVPALRLAALALGIGIVAFAAVALLNTEVWNRPALGGATGAQTFLVADKTQQGTLLGYLSYTWQFFLPALPGMTPHFPAALTTQQIWFNGFVGLFGWINIVHPKWVYDWARFPASIALILLGATLVQGRVQLRRRRAELIAYAALAIGLVAEIGAASYSLFLNHGGTFGQSRYLLPFASLFAVALALVARAGGARWGPALGALIVITVLAHDIGSQLQVVSKWYA